MENAYGDVIEFRKTASSPANSAKRDTLIENQAILVLVLQLDLFVKVRGQNATVLSLIGRATYEFW